MIHKSVTWQPQKGLEYSKIKGYSVYINSKKSCICATALLTSGTLQHKFELVRISLLLSTLNKTMHLVSHQGNLLCITKLPVTL